MALHGLAPLAVLACVLTAASAYAGQLVGDTSGAIAGTVADSTGAALQGVTIGLSSDALMGTRTTTTDGAGRYWFAALPPGNYSLRFERQDFATLTRDDVRVGISATATVDVRLDLAGLREGVIVERGAPLVDRQATALGTAFDARQLASLPSSRSLFSILAATPSVRVARFEVGGNTGDAGSPYGAYGTYGANRPMLEGIHVTGIFPTGFKLDYGTFDDVSVGTGSHSAEWPAPGVQMQIVTKSGGNRYRGTLYADYEHREWQSRNVDVDQIARGAAGRANLPARDANRLWRYYDVNADAGGYIARDAVWWYASFRDQDVSQRQVNYPVEPLRTHATNYTVKITAQLNANHRLVGFAQAGRTEQPARLDPFGPIGGTLNAATAINESFGDTLRQRGWGWVAKGEWTATLGRRAVLELRGGTFGADRSQTPNSTAPRFEDLGTLRVSGGNRDWQDTLDRPQVLGALTYTTDRGPGTHDFKLGGQLTRNRTSESWHQGYAGNVLHVLRNGVPVEAYLFQAPSRSDNGLAIYQLYGSDAWRLHDRLTLTLGLRFDRSRVFLPAQAHPAGRFNPVAENFAPVDNVIDWNTLAPRLGAVIDPGGDGRTFAKVSYGRYWINPAGEVGPNVNPNAPQWWRRYAWTDPNRSGVWEPGEEGRLLGSRGGVALESIDPDLEPAYLDEVAAWIERDLDGRTSVRTGVVWRAERQHWMRQDASRPFQAFKVPVVVPDPGADATAGTSDDGRAVLAFDLPPDVLARIPSNIVKSVPDSDVTYLTWEAVADRRLSGRWSLVASFDYTWSREHASAYFGQAVRNNVYPLTPNDLINTGAHGRHEFGTWSAKIHGTYEAPWDVRITPMLRHQSGQPYGRTFLANLSYGTVRILAEPIGTRRMDDVTTADVRLEKAFRLPGDRRVAAFVDVFNLFNANPEQNVSWSSGSFLRPLTIVSPRIVRIGAKLDW